MTETTEPGNVQSGLDTELHAGLQLAVVANVQELAMNHHQRVTIEIHAEVVVAVGLAGEHALRTLQVADVGLLTAYPCLMTFEASGKRMGHRYERPPIIMELERDAVALVGCTHVNYFRNQPSEQSCDLGALAALQLQ